jgi:hypothetical protein
LPRLRVTTTVIGLMRLGHRSAILWWAPLAGCTGAVSVSPGAGDADAMTTSAVVIVERTLDPSGGARAQTSARFVRVAARSSKQDALRTIGATLDLPARGSCASIAAFADGVPQHEQTPVIELTDVGTISLEASQRETRLIPRQLPDVTDVVTGVVYARAVDPLLLPAGTEYIVHVGGGSEVDPVDAPAAAPADPTDVHVVGEDATGKLVTGGAGVELTWIPDGTDDSLYIDIQPAGFRCVLGDGQNPPADHAATTVPASLFDDAGTISVHRVRRENLAARGLESGEIRFDFSRSVHYARR